MGQKGMWNRGIVFAADSVNQSTFQDLCSSQHKSIDIRGSPTYAIWQESSRSKNLFAGNTSVAGELRLSGGVVHIRDGKEYGAVLTSAGREELASSGVVRLSGDGSATVAILSVELCSDVERDDSGGKWEHSYQLTAHGRPMPNLFVASELEMVQAGDDHDAHCRFSIGGGGQGGGKVSWRLHSSLA
jgi:hypothetical protein